MNIYVGNLPYKITEEELSELFEPYGAVDQVRIINDRDTGKSKGFGFVEMGSGGNEAIEKLHESDVMGRRIIVNEARPRESRPPRR